MNLADSKPSTRYRVARALRRGLSLALLLGLGPVCAATLGDALNGALETAQQQARVGAARSEGAAVRRQADSLLAADPAVRGKALSDALTGDAGAYELEAMVDMPLWMPGQRDARRAVADSLTTQADALHGYLRWEMAGRVREAVWAAALAQGQLVQASAALESARALERDIRKRADAGELARVDLLVAQQETLTREVDLQRAQNEYDLAIHAYVHLTGLPALPSPLTEGPARVSGDMDAVPPDHPLLASSSGAVARARAERDQVQSERRGHPTLSLGAKQARDARGSESDTALQLEISLPFGMAAQAAPGIASAERVYTDAVAAQSLDRLEAEHALHAAHLGVLGAAEALSVAERRQALTADALALMRRAFDLGEADLTGLLQAQERARQASLDLELRRLEQGRAASRLNQALGLVPQ